MSNYIQSGFGRLNIGLDERILQQVERFMIVWEIRGNHSLALNGRLLAVHPIAFTTSDREEFFKIFNVSEREMATIVRAIPSINNDFKVVSDPFNLQCVWVMHLAYRKIAALQAEHKLTQKQVEEAFDLFAAGKRSHPVLHVWFSFLFHISKIMHYKFFTSLVNNSFKHGANEQIMEATMNSLSQKFDIIGYGTWKRSIEARCLDLISYKSNHYAGFRDGVDAALLYIISDSQTRIRAKIVKIARAYYDMHKNGEAIASRSTVGSNAEGEKVITQMVGTFDKLTSTLVVEVLNANVFLNSRLVTQIASPFTNISSGMLESTLLAFSELASVQSKAGQLDRVGTDSDGNEIYFGARILINNLVQKSIRYCLRKNIPITDKAAIFVKVKNIYSSSRISDPEIIKVKNSIAYFVDSIGGPKRETTKSSLRLAMIMYVLTKALVRL